MTTRAFGDRMISRASAWKYGKNSGTLGTSSTAVTRMSHDSNERNVVPIPKQMTSASAGCRSRNTSGTCAIHFVTGVSTVVEAPP
jgi:hypothetical protein